MSKNDGDVQKNIDALTGALSISRVMIDRTLDIYELKAIFDANKTDKDLHTLKVLQSKVLSATFAVATKNTPVEKEKALTELAYLLVTSANIKMNAMIKDKTAEDYFVKFFKGLQHSHIMKGKDIKAVFKHFKADALTSLLEKAAAPEKKIAPKKPTAKKKQSGPKK